MHYVERSVVLQTLDHLWREHIVNLDHLRSVIGFRGYAQRDPLQEYKSEAFELFQALLDKSPSGRHRTADARRTGAAKRRGAAAGTAADGRPPSRPATGEDDFADSDQRSNSSSRRKTATRRIHQPGARSAATRPAPAARARNTSTATVLSRRAWVEPCFCEPKGLFLKRRRDCRPACLFAYFWKLTRTAIDQPVRVFRIISVTLNGFCHIDHLQIRQQGRCLSREARLPGDANWFHARCFCRRMQPTIAYGLSL